MATFAKIDGAEPSTVTFRLATVTQDRGGQTQHQEIVTLGGSESTLAIAQVRATAPASTEFGLVVRVAGGPSSVADFAVRAVLPSTATDNPVSAAQAGTWNIATVTSVSSLSTGHVTVDTGSIRVHQSSAADLNVTVAGYVAPSTTVAVSTVQGVVRIAGNNAADGIVHVGDSTNAALRVNVVAGAAGGSTIVTVNGNASSNSSLYLPVRLTNGTAFLTASQDYLSGDTASNITGPPLLFDNGSNATMRHVSATLGLPVNVIAGAAGGSTYVSVRQSTATDLNAAVIQGSTNWSVQVSTGAISVSTGSITVHQGSTNFSVQVSTGAVSVSTGSITVHQGSTNFSVQVSTGAVSVSTGSVTVHQGSTLFSVLARNTTSSGGGVEGSTTTPVGGILGLHVRQVVPTMNSTTVVVTSTHSTAIYEIISSAAALRHKVFAYFIGSTHTNPSTLIFCSSASASGFDHWAVNFGSGSSGITGANLAVPPPGYIFAGIAQNALNVRVEGGSSGASTCIVRIAVSWFDEA